MPFLIFNLDLFLNKLCELCVLSERNNKKSLRPFAFFARDKNKIILAFFAFFARGYINMKKALITGITGQDGSYLVELLLEKGYVPEASLWESTRHNSSCFNFQYETRINHLYKDPHNKNIKMFLHYGDMTDSSNLNRVLEKVQPDEIYPAGMSFQRSRRTPSENLRST